MASEDECTLADFVALQCANCCSHWTDWRGTPMNGSLSLLWPSKMWVDCSWFRSLNYLVTLLLTNTRKSNHFFHDARYGQLFAEVRYEQAHRHGWRFTHLCGARLCSPWVSVFLDTPPPTLPHTHTQTLMIIVTSYDPVQNTNLILDGICSTAPPEHWWSLWPCTKHQPRTRWNLHTDLITNINCDVVLNSDTKQKSIDLLHKRGTFVMKVSNGLPRTSAALQASKPHSEAQLSICPGNLFSLVQLIHSNYPST